MRHGDFRERLDHEGVAGVATSGNVEFDKEILTLYHRPKEENFIGQTRGDRTITAEDVTQDITRLNDFEQSPKFSKEKGTHAVLAEYAILHGINKLNWFGPNATAELTSRYDDYMNGIDLLITIKNPGQEPLVFGIDATASVEESVLEHKYQRELDKAVVGRGTRLKYSNWDKPVQIMIVALQPLIFERLAEVMTGNTKYADLELAAKTVTLELLIREATNNIGRILDKQKLPHPEFATTQDVIDYLKSEGFTQDRKTLSKSILAEFYTYNAIIKTFEQPYLDAREILTQKEKGEQLYLLTHNKMINRILTGLTTTIATINPVIEAA